ncbi:hypothetical protein F7725_022847, partial [Dissostichus mawsoni]
MIEEELAATLLLSVICLFMCLCLQTLLTLFSFLFQLLSDMGEYKEAMEVLKRALKLEPTTKAIHAELSKLVRRQSGGKDTQEWISKPAAMLGDNITPFLIPSKKKPS